jgi:hypothetical protein
VNEPCSDLDAQCIYMFLAVVSSSSREVNVLIMTTVCQVCIRTETKAHTLQSKDGDFSFPCLPQKRAKVMSYCLPSTILSRVLVTAGRVRMSE